MELTFTGKTRINDIKHQFARLFPLLKLQFFSYRQGRGEGVLLPKVLPGDTLLADAVPGFKDAVFVVTPTITVAEFQQQLQAETGLLARVFCKAGMLWPETLQSAHLTLEQWNRLSNEAASLIRFNLHTLFL